MMVINLFVYTADVNAWILTIAYKDFAQRNLDIAASRFSDSPNCCFPGDYEDDDVCQNDSPAGDQSHFIEDRQWIG